MRDVSAVRELTPQLQAAKINVLLLNIHQPPGSDLLERLAFKASPTYLVFDISGAEIWRDFRLPTLDTVLALTQ